jgi:hypothetical protein
MHSPYVSKDIKYDIIALSTARAFLFSDRTPLP